MERIWGLGFSNNGSYFCRRATSNVSGAVHWCSEESGKSVLMTPFGHWIIFSFKIDGLTYVYTRLLLPPAFSSSWRRIDVDIGLVL
jgi:hypothetical protein